MDLEEIKKSQVIIINDLTEINNTLKEKQTLNNWDRERTN